ncbi:hypothetical protein ACTMTF_06670 [Nonomuraea sp. ZG12]|uniref:hypothetical protein n=1 Tax=Nonomuraea sp. ZG12 TaxID=3452207 RepID=UPI003F88F651
MSPDDRGQAVEQRLQAELEEPVEVEPAGQVVDDPAKAGYAPDPVMARRLSSCPLIHSSPALDLGQQGQQGQGAAPEDVQRAANASTLD